MVFAGWTPSWKSTPTKGKAPCRSLQQNANSHLIGPFLCSTGHRLIPATDSVTVTSAKLSTTGAIGAIKERNSHFITQFVY